MAAITGKNGTLTYGGSAEAEVTNIRVKESANVSKWASNDSAGWKKGVSGVKDFAGSFTMKDKPTFSAGDGGSLVIYDGLINIWTCAVLIQDIDTEIDMDDGSEVGYDVTFEGNGAMTKSTGSAP